MDHVRIRPDTHARANGRAAIANTSPASPPQLWLRSAGVVILLALVALVAVRPLLTDPAARPISAPQRQFAAWRAMEHVANIGNEPHPAGSDEMERVADYITRHLDELDLGITRHNPGELRNVAARLPGLSPSGAVLFVAHADTFDGDAPGAGDNTTGVATLLEMARVLARGPRPMNDVIFLFSDGQESGLRGGRAFAEEHPWMEEVQLVVGVDTAAWGPPVVTQVGDDAGELVRAYATSVRPSYAHGLMAAASHRARSSISPFRERGLPSMEIEDARANPIQRTERDTPARVDPARIQQLGDTLLGLTEETGAADLRAVRYEDRSFTTMPLLGAVHYPPSWDSLFSAAAMVVLGTATWMGVRGGHLRPRRLLVAISAAVTLVALSGIAGWLAVVLYEWIEPNPNPKVEAYLLPSGQPYVIVVSVLLAVGFAVGYHSLQRLLGAVELAVGWLIVWLTVSVSVLVVLPQAAYLFSWTAVLSSVVALIALRFPRAADGLAIVTAVLLVAVVTPLALIGHWTAGVAHLALHALVLALVGGVIAPAIVGVRHSVAASPSPRLVPYRR